MFSKYGKIVLYGILFCKFLQFIYKYSEKERVVLVDLKLIIAGNIIKLRTDAGMTQSDLGERLNYSDKSVSKWERAESLPDANVLKQLGEIFGVSVDFLMNTHTEWEPKKKADEEKKIVSVNFKVLTTIALTGVWSLALFLFILLWIVIDIRYWIVFAGTLPVSILTHLILNSVWNAGKHNRYIIGAFCLSVIMLVYFVLLARNIWQIFLLMVPVILLIGLSTKIVKKR